MSNTTTIKQLVKNSDQHNSMPGIIRSDVRDLGTQHGNTFASLYQAETNQGV